MIQGYCSKKQDFNSLMTKLQPWGNVVVFGERSLRFVPHDQSYPPVYFNKNGSIDIWTASNDPFYQDDCLQIIEQWLGETITLPY
jgi:hypothetical protein